MTDIRERATELRRLHDATELLQVVNVWDAVSTTVIAGLPETRAIATASHSIAASFGYEDGEKIPLDLMLDAIARIVDATDLPVSADLEAGYGDPGTTIRRAIGVGAVGANLEDAKRPFAEAVAAVRAAVAAADAEGVRFALNARTDVFLGEDPRPAEEKAREAIERGRAFLDEGATCVFVPGLLDEATIETLVGGLGERKLSVIGVPGSVAPARLQELGVARVSYGPWTQRVALTALQDAARELYAGGALPEGTRPLN
ncbi:isocitrate lyase/PEP mutase family protein [Leifsonia poae]|uniref:Phosphonomutase n=1 Tax=Leifsonia poae TaxID=110933 RepID=A0A9W6HAQ8_9MICO|nr:isocitrate lyase/phosphoenolpyruvate mutase family protein [Leifsonia poae]GLJ76852.1 phosphonomutase [Leifsonia poae]